MVPLLPTSLHPPLHLILSRLEAQDDMISSLHFPFLPQTVRKTWTYPQASPASVSSWDSHLLSTCPLQSAPSWGTLPFSTRSPHGPASLHPPSQSPRPSLLLPAWRKWLTRLPSTTTAETASTGRVTPAAAATAAAPLSPMPAAALKESVPRSCLWARLSSHRWAWLFQGVGDLCSRRTVPRAVWGLPCHHRCTPRLPCTSTTTTTTLLGCSASAPPPVGAWLGEEWKTISGAAVEGRGLE